jgi:glycosyltransferase involved in cell wall biosynthesis
MNWPEVTVLIVTYDRLKVIERVLFALLKHLHYPREKLRWIIADDSSPDDYVERLSGLKVCQLIQPRFSVTERNSGFGVNVNLGLRAVETEYCLFIEDDKLLEHDLDLRQGVALLETRQNIGMLRYRGTGGEPLIFHLFESDISHYMPDYQDGVGLSGRLNYLQLDSGSHALYLYTNGPHLKRRSFHEFYGYYPEGYRLGETEEKMAHQVKDLMLAVGAPAIAILPEWVKMWWTDIGESRQHTELDREYVKAV